MNYLTHIKLFNHTSLLTIKWSIYCDRYAYFDSNERENESRPVVSLSPAKGFRFSLSKKHCLVLVGSRNRLDRDFYKAKYTTNSARVVLQSGVLDKYHLYAITI